MKLIFFGSFSQAAKTLLGILNFFLGISGVSGIIPEFQEI
jgi:hypothetical protein